MSKIMKKLIFIRKYTFLNGLNNIRNRTKCEIMTY